MHEWVAALIAGLVGGVVNAILTGGFQMPRVTRGDEDQTIVDPGFVGTILIGGVAGLGVWGSGAEVSFSDSDLNVKPIIGALLAGCAGAEVLNSLIARQYSAATNRQTGTATESSAAAVTRAAGAVEKMTEELKSTREREREIKRKNDAAIDEPKDES
jgi:hypothetical protein